MWVVLGLVLGCGTGRIGVAELATEPAAAPGEAAAAPMRPPTRGPPVVMPDILFITWDTTRADHLGMYGYPRATTPRLDALAAEGVVFERFIVPMSTTLPSHTSMFTGVRPEEHGILANTTFTGERFIPSARLVTLASWLRGRGYATGGFVSSTPVKDYSGINAGFAGWDQPRGDHRRAEETVDRAAAWLRRAPADAPIFQWVHLYDPHYPYEPPPGLRDHFADDRALREHLGEVRYAAMGGDRVERINAYDAEIFYLDRETGRLLKLWRESGRWERTIVIFAGDHGEGLGQHGSMEHGLTWDEQLHAPLVIRAPGLAPGRLPAPVSAHDLVATVLGLADIPDEQELARQTTGHDLLAPDFVPLPVFSRSSVRQVRKGNEASFCLTTERWKFEFRPDGGPSLYDLQADPHELRDVADDHPDVVIELKRLGAAMFAEQRSRAAELGAGSTEKLAPDILGELKHLGYLE